MLPNISAVKGCVEAWVGVLFPHLGLRGGGGQENFSSRVLVLLRNECEELDCPTAVSVISPRFSRSPNEGPGVHTGHGLAQRFPSMIQSLPWQDAGSCCAVPCALTVGVSPQRPAPLAPSSPPPGRPKGIVWIPL